MRARASIRSAYALIALHWREADRASRLQVLGGIALVGIVFSVFAVGATRRDGPDAPAALAGPGGPAAGGKQGDRPGAGSGPAERPGPGARAESGGGLPAAGGGPAPSGRAPRGDPRRRRGRRPGSPVEPGSGAGGTTPVVVGVAYRDPSAAAALAEALGLEEPAGRAPAQAVAVAEWINAHGKVAGHPLELRLAPFDPALVPSYPQAFAQACSTVAAGFVRPVAVVAAVEDAAAQTGCLAPGGIALVGDGPAAGDREAFADAGAHLFAPGSMALDRLAAAEVRVLVREGFLDRRSRVGVLRLDGPSFERAERRALRPALQETGASVVADVALPYARSAAEAPALLAGIALAVLRFRTADVDRVVVLEAGFATPLFMREAERQGFRPRYGLNSTMAPGSLPGRVPPAQLRGAVGAGFAPLLDVAGEGEPEPPATRRRCEEIYRAAGVGMGARSAAGQFAAVALCDGLLAIRDALDAARDPSAGALAGALEGLGGARPAAVAIASRLDRDNHDGAAETRALSFDGGCDCMRYSGAAEAAR